MRVMEAEMPEMPTKIPNIWDRYEHNPERPFPTIAGQIAMIRSSMVKLSLGTRIEPLMLW